MASDEDRPAAVAGNAFPIDADPQWVWVQYRFPAGLHRAAKTLAAARDITLRQLILESLAAEVARGYHPPRGPSAWD